MCHKGVMGLPLQERGSFAVVEQAWVWEAGDTGLNFGSITDLLQYGSVTKIIGKMSGYRSNYDLQKLNVTHEYP